MDWLRKSSKLQDTLVPQIKYRYFWKQFKSADFFLTKIISNETRVSKFEIHSVYKPLILRVIDRRFLLMLVKYDSFKKFYAFFLEYKKARGVRRIWWTGENIRPPIELKFDSYISFDQDEMGGKNCYFPLLYSEIIFSSSDSKSRHGTDYFDPKSLLKPRILSTGLKPKFVCVFINNPEPTRLRAIKELSVFGSVEVYGKLTGRSTDEKFSIARNFRYMLCFENSLFPGYLSEKLLDAYICDTIPLYWGLFGSERHINRKALINAADFLSLESFAQYVGNISELQYKEIYTQPLMNSLPNLDHLNRALRGFDSTLY